MFEYRVTKYDPRLRDRSGAYRRDEWISPDQIGQTFGGVVFTAAEYQRTEDAYVAAAMAFLRESGCVSLRVVQLENSRPFQEPGILLSPGVTLCLADLERVCRLNLRGTIWCKLEDDAGRFIHFGYDYYMYIGVPTPCETAKALAPRLGLFVETFPSPYRWAEMQAPPP
jgi:hypothetical protein